MNEEEWNQQMQCCCKRLGKKLKGLFIPLKFLAMIENIDYLFGLHKTKDRIAAFPSTLVFSQKEMFFG
jgi:hypothetical protein